MGFLAADFLGDFFGFLTAASLAVGFFAAGFFFGSFSFFYLLGQLEGTTSTNTFGVYKLSIGNSSLESHLEMCTDLTYLEVAFNVFLNCLARGTISLLQCLNGNLNHLKIWWMIGWVFQLCRRLLFRRLSHCCCWFRRFETS